MTWKSPRSRGNAKPDAIDEELAALRRRVEQAERERDALQKQVDEAKAFLEPLMRDWEYDESPAVAEPHGDAAHEATP